MVISCDLIHDYVIKVIMPVSHLQSACVPSWVAIATTAQNCVKVRTFYQCHGDIWRLDNHAHEKDTYKLDAPNLLLQVMISSMKDVPGLSSPSAC